MPLTRVSAGERDRVVTIQQATQTREPGGMPKEDWTDLVKVWASRYELGGNERFWSNQVSAPYDTKWQIPYRIDMDPEIHDVAKNRRLVVRGRIHDIVQAVVIDRYAGIELITRSGAML